MSDGLNDARAMRLAEIVSDFRAIVTQLNNVTSRDHDPGPEMGHTVMRACGQEARTLLNMPVLTMDPGATSDPDQVKISLRKMILAMSTPRFQAERAYLRAMAAARWIQRRQLLASRPGTNTQAAMQQIDQTLRQELATITDQRVYSDLRQKDVAAQRWMVEDPALDAILAFVRSQ